MKKILATLMAVSLPVFSLIVGASANKPKPGQVSTSCYFNFGPKVGQTENLKAFAKPVLLGRPCTDNNGSTGISVLDKEAAEAEEAEEVAEAALKAGKKKYSSQVRLSSVCQFNEGPRSGEVENFQDKNPPIPVGTPCSDGVNSIGVTIAE
ncbi:MAG: hypothetical protein PHW13_05065 [Methylococcales bacterium]|nr:hypothetical protein [Methylococcales bacterium]